MSNQCKHENTKTESYPQQYYFTMSIDTVVTCVDCGEILYEESKKI